MKEFKNFIITIALTLVMSLAILIIASCIFIPKWTNHDGNMMTYIIKGFYEEPKNSLDIVFLGNSDVYRGVSPMELYNQTGITSYNFVSAGQRMWITYPMFEEVLKKQNPKMIFLNVDAVFFTSNASTGNYHKVYDQMPLSKTKIAGVYDENYELEDDTKLKHFLPIITYHNRYGELTDDDFKYAFYKSPNPTKGMDLVAIKSPYISETNYMEYTDEIASIPEKNKKYLDKMTELCTKNNIEFVLFEIPSADSWNYKKSNAIRIYAEENNLRFIDLNYEEALDNMEFDWQTDTSDGGDHLNIFGAEKVTTYLANYLKENYDFVNHKEDEKYSYWNEQYKEYLKIKAYELENN